MKENRSVNRILSILELVAAHPEGLTLGQIYRELDMPKATAYDFLQTLYKADAIYYKRPTLKKLRDWFKNVCNWFCLYEEFELN